MVALFRKEKEIKFISAEDKDKLAEAAKNLGYDVGYHHHSEIGWVQENLSRLDEFAAQYDLKDFAREQYSLGKEEGSRSKNRDTTSALSGGLREEDEKRVLISTARVEAHNLASKVKSGYRDVSYEFSNSSAPIQQPGLISIPESVEFPTAVKRPSILEGSKHLLPRK
jgi:hypothetical protein